MAPFSFPFLLPYSPLLILTSSSLGVCASSVVSRDDKSLQDSLRSRGRDREAADDHPEVIVHLDGLLEQHVPIRSAHATNSSRRIKADRSDLRPAASTDIVQLARRQLLERTESWR